MKKEINLIVLALNKSNFLRQLSSMFINVEGFFNSKQLFVSSFFCLLILLTACEKDKKETKTEATKLSTEEIDAIVEGSTKISSAVQTFMSSSMAVAGDSGYNGGTPTDVAVIKKNNFSNLKMAGETYTDGWIGPDNDGWYTRYWSGIYNYTEKVRKRDTIDYVITMEYHGGDGSFSNSTTTRYIKHIENDSVLFDGYSIWEIEAFGDNDISSTEWRIEFKDWNPQTSAGIYDWYWGVSENNGGNTVPLYRFEHLVAKETMTEGWLKCRVIYYEEDGTEVWDFEYDTPWVPVVMPVIPDTPKEF